MINHLDRYLLELGANELLLQIIVVRDPFSPDLVLGLDGRLGLQDADRMCELLHQPHQAEGKLYSIIHPRAQLIDQKNLQKIAKFTVEILVSNECNENLLVRSPSFY